MSASSKRAPTTAGSPNARQLRLWFRSQDTEVAPLIVEAPADGAA